MYMDIIKNNYVISAVTAIVAYIVLYFYRKNEKDPNLTPEKKKNQMYYDILIALGIGAVVFICLKMLRKKEPKLTTIKSDLTGGDISKSSIKIPKNDIFVEMFN